MSDSWSQKNCRTPSSNMLELIMLKTGNKSSGIWSQKSCRTSSSTIGSIIIWRNSSCWHFYRVDEPTFCIIFSLTGTRIFTSYFCFPTDISFLSLLCSPRGSANLTYGFGLRTFLFVLLWSMTPSTSPLDYLWFKFWLFFFHTAFCVSLS